MRSRSLFPRETFFVEIDLSLSLSLFPKKKKLTIIFSISKRRYDTADVVKRVKKLLKGHEDLLDGFNCFLPDVSISLLFFFSFQTPPPGTTDSCLGGRVLSVLSIGILFSLFGGPFFVVVVWAHFCGKV